MLFIKKILYAGKKYLEEASLWCLRIIEAACDKQESFLDALRETGAAMIVSQADKLLMGINPRSGKADHLVNLVKYVEFVITLIHQQLQISSDKIYYIVISDFSPFTFSSQKQLNILYLRFCIYV